MKYNAAFLDHIAPGTIDHEAIVEPALKALLGEVDGKRALDIGCGSGRYSRLLADNGAIVTGVDKSQNQLELARAAEGANPKGIDYELADVRTWTIVPGSYDLVLLMFVVVDTRTPEALEGIVQAAARALAKGGRLLIADVHPHNFGRDNPVEIFSPKKQSCYFDNGAESYSDTWLTNGDKVRFDPSFHYRLDFVFNMIADQNLILERFMEPRYRADFPTHMVIAARKG